VRANSERFGYVFAIFTLDCSGATTARPFRCNKICLPFRVLIVNENRIGYTRCEDCRGTGKKDDETSCVNCGGTGWVAVFTEPTVRSTQPVPSSDRRRFTRYYTDLRVELLDQEEQAFAGRCTIVAEGGLGAILPQAFPTGSVVRLQLSIPTHAAALTVRAVVRNQKGLRHGFEFLSLTDSERVAIKKFCNRLMPQADYGDS